MTKSTISRERVVALIAEHSYDSALVDALEHLLAAIDSEPVAWTWHYREQWHVTNDERRAEFVAKDGDVAVLPLYRHAQPAPAVPGKWIPVSERMPEDRTQVILWDAEIGEVTSGHYSHKTQTFYHCGDAIENEITHWMLPPSAPQGVKP
ncbi:TPA: DUF551 domain-containing protein [Klebsiella quasipneumoniae]|uniref:DUF551 domain-containing protein n=1 Tax=Klebsiella/Raoultella group TaxID=2890311 RepID=UPI00065A0A17|nr:MULTISPECIES: DUF551 domain-containing protein [Klebsiella/Raoultella group]MCP5803726.1 DUF551 domain-containing protein [Klebsiella pneumoniae]HBW1978196.1 DUF551 domain-containing protein [Klebsiella quasipneumoniae subsp. similipneumoniae]KMH86348.1 hypothetical protein SM79_01506 [Klebsiella quasipneumoniae]MEB8239921.1 DUF551 domain-containing protein [Raoultella ornithinolytica]HCM6422322.1 DUF551 domain-containing protein [Klebsiella quasipneumoniae]